MNTLRRIGLGAAVTAVAASFLQLIVPSAANAATFSAFTLKNGWTNAPFSTRPAGGSVISGVVTLKGAIATTGSNLSPFTLPSSMRPKTNVYVKADLCNANNGRLNIATNGVVTVQPENGTSSNATCFTSLEGISFALTASSYTPLTLINGWSGAPFATSSPAGRVISGIVHLKGAMSTSGSSVQPFVLPPGMRPASTVWAPVDTIGATNGRLIIQPNGLVTVQDESQPQGGAAPNAAGFTSLDGVSFAAASAGGFTPLTLQNGWTASGFSTTSPAVRDVSGVVHLEGTMSTSGTNGVAFTLPVEFRPSKTVYVYTDTFGATNGRLVIQPSGTVSIQDQGATSISNSSRFTSLDGVSWPSSTFASITPKNGWTSGPFSTRSPAATVVSGVVTLKGAIATSGTNPVAFTLPSSMRPKTDVFVKADLCNANNGRLDISPNGVVSVEAEGGTFSNAQCFTSLEGISFAQNASSYTTLGLINGWTGSPFGTSSPAGRVIAGIVHLKGAIASGTASEAFVLPASMRPANTVWLPVDMCGATNGRLEILTTGAVFVQAESSFSNAQCFTSLDGVSFATSSAGFTSLSLQNGWLPYGFGTAPAAVRDVSGVVHLRGAIASGSAAQAFTLPAEYRPTKTVYVYTDTVNATNGRLVIQPSGTVSVEDQGGTSISNSSGFTSLDGVSWPS